MIAFIIFMVVFGLSGWVFALWVNDDWYRDSIETIEFWYARNCEINDMWHSYASELAKKLDEIEKERMGRSRG